MGKYFMHWRLNNKLISSDPNERGAGYEALIKLVKRDITNGMAKDWDAYIGENSGHCVIEGPQVSIMKMVQQYTPYVIFETHPIASVNQPMSGREHIGKKEHADIP